MKALAIVAAVVLLVPAAAAAKPDPFYGVSSQTPLGTGDYKKMGKAHVGTLRADLSWSGANPSRTSMPLAATARSARARFTAGCSAGKSPYRHRGNPSCPIAIPASTTTSLRCRNGSARLSSVCATCSTAPTPR